MMVSTSAKRHLVDSTLKNNSSVSNLKYLQITDDVEAVVLVLPAESLRFVVATSRLLEIFEKEFETTNLTLEPEILYDSTKYCTKDETRKVGPFYVGTDSYRQKMTPMTIKLRRWQTIKVDFN